MVEPNVQPFRAEMTYDLFHYRELEKSYGRYSLRASAVKLAVIALLLAIAAVYAVWLESARTAGWMLLLCLGAFWGAMLITCLRRRDGGIGYKRMLSNNGGKTVRYEYTFLAEGIRVYNPDTNGVHTFAYSQVKGLYETENLLVICLEHKQVLPLEKNSLAGGPIETFSEKLLAASGGGKKKSSLLPGKLIHGALIAVSVVAALLSMKWLLPDMEFQISRQTYRQAAQKLEEFGITGISEDMLAELEMLESEYSGYSPDKYRTLLCWAGMGTYDQETWEWTPSECGVYWFDAEVFGVETMYTDFLRGVRSLDSQTLNFTDIAENTEKVNWEKGTGLQSVSFTWNGEAYTLTGRVHYDWFDLDVANDLNTILGKGSDRKLYFAWDGGQGYLVFYADAQWASAFQKATGIMLSPNPKRLDAVF